MFYILCDVTVICAIFGLVLSVFADVRRSMTKKNKKCRADGIANLSGLCFVLGFAATAVCFFAGI